MQNQYIASRIKLICKDKKKTLSELIEQCNLAKSFIYDTEKRFVSPSCDKISRIADYLDCSVDYLLGRTDNPNSHKVLTEQPKMTMALKAARSFDDRPMEIIEVDEEKLKNAPTKKL